MTQLLESPPRAQTSFELPPPDQVKAKARAGAGWSLLLTAARYLIILGTTFVLARILSPHDFGLVAMVTSLTAVFEVLSDMGLSWATIQKKNLSEAEVSSLFWLNTAMGGALALSCVVAGPILERLYGQPEMAAIAPALGLCYLIKGFSIQQTAMLRRRMNFRGLFFAEAAPAVLGGAAALLTAIWGWGYWALVIQLIVIQLGRGLAVFSMTRYRPGRPKWHPGTLSLVRFGGYLAVSQLIYSLARNLDGVFIGAYWGPEDAGYYSRAYALILAPVYLTSSAIGGVLVPALSSLKEDFERMARAFRTSVEMSAFICFPVAAGIVATSSESVRLLYGPDWLPVAPMLCWLSLSCVMRPISQAQQWLVIAYGRPRITLVLAVVSTLASVCTYAFAVRWGAVGVAAARGLASILVLAPISLVVVHREVNLNLWLTLRPIVPVFLCSTLMGAAVWMAGAMLYQAAVAWYQVLAVKIVLGVSTYLLLMRLFSWEMVQRMLRHTGVVASARRAA